MKHKAKKLGEVPMLKKDRESLEIIAQALDEYFNGAGKGPAKIGFLLLVFKFGDKDGVCNYISNGASRTDTIRFLREQADRFEEIEKRKIQ